VLYDFSLKRQSATKRRCVSAALHSVKNIIQIIFSISIKKQNNRLSQNESLTRNCLLLPLQLTFLNPFNRFPPNTARSFSEAPSHEKQRKLKL